MSKKLIIKRGGYDFVQRLDVKGVVLSTGYDVAEYEGGHREDRLLRASGAQKELVKMKSTIKGYNDPQGFIDLKSKDYTAAASLAGEVEMRRLSEYIEEGYEAKEATRKAEADAERFLKEEIRVIDARYTGAEGAAMKKVKGKV